MFCPKCGTYCDDGLAFCPNCGNDLGMAGTNNMVNNTAADECFPSWNIVSEIGRGGFGKVYKIERNEFGNKYVAAMKVIHIPNEPSEINELRADGMTPSDISAYFRGCIQDFTAEFALMSKLKGNSYIVSYEDHMIKEHSDGIGADIYIRMELLTPLTKYLETKTLSTKEVVKMGIDICNALEACALHAIVHRDIKPDNIFISDIGNFKLGDFGIARTLDKNQTVMTRKGTLGYIAPEVYKGEPSDHTVDIYSLGLIMYRLLNRNRLPFLPSADKALSYTDKENAMNRRMMGERITPPCDADVMLGNIIVKACSYLPSDRYRSASEFKAVLEGYLVDQNQMSYSNQAPAASVTVDLPLNTAPVSNAAPADANNETMLLFDNNITANANNGYTEVLYPNQIPPAPAVPVNSYPNNQTYLQGNMGNGDASKKKFPVWIPIVGGVVVLLIALIAILAGGNRHSSYTPASSPQAPVSSSESSPTIGGSDTVTANSEDTADASEEADEISADGNSSTVEDDIVTDNNATSVYEDELIYVDAEGVLEVDFDGLSRYNLGALQNAVNADPLKENDLWPWFFDGADCTSYVTWMHDSNGNEMTLVTINGELAVIYYDVFGFNETLCESIIDSYMGIEDYLDTADELPTVEDIRNQYNVFICENSNDTWYIVSNSIYNNSEHVRQAYVWPERFPDNLDPYVLVIYW